MLNRGIEGIGGLAMCLLLMVSGTMAQGAETDEAGEAVPAPDEMVLNNGSRIVGTVTSSRDGSVVIETDFAGTLTIAITEIESLRTNSSAVLQMADGAVIRDVAFQVQQDSLVVEQVAESAQTYPVSALLIVNPEPWELGEGYKWTGLADFAMKIERGNTVTDELDVRVDNVWRSLRDRYTAKFNAELDEANDQRNAENWTLIGKYDYFLEDTNYWGVNAFAEQDKFADLDLRTYLGPYIGREFYEDPLFTLGAEVGISWVAEDYIEADDQEYPGANWNLRMSSNYLGGDSSLYFDQIGIWNLDETSDIIVNTVVGLSFPLIWGLSAAAEFDVRYNGGAVEGVEEIDETYSFRIGYTW